MRWTEKSLDELGFVGRGKSKHRPRDAEFLYGGPHPFIQTGDVKHAELYVTSFSQTYSDAGLAQSKMWPAGTLCITIAANIAETAILGLDACFPDSIIGFIADEAKSDARFIKYKLDTIKSRYRQVSQGAAQDNLSLEKLLSFKLRVPEDASAQRDIADLLSAYDELMENNRRRMALLEEAARLLYQEWFVRLRFPGHEHTRITKGVPEGWKKSSLFEYVARNLVRIQTGPFGTQLRASDYTETGTPVINVRNIGYGNLRPDKLEFVSDEIMERLSVHVLKAGDIVFGRKGAVDRHLLVSPDLEGWMQGSDCINLRSFSDELSTTLLSFAFRQESHKQWMLTQCGNKATMASLNQDVIGRISVILPTSNLLREFQDFVHDVLRQIGVLERQNKKLREARDLLLPRLMNGGIAV